MGIAPLLLSSGRLPARCCARAAEMDAAYSAVLRAARASALRVSPLPDDKRLRGQLTLFFMLHRWLCKETRRSAAQSTPAAPPPPLPPPPAAAAPAPAAADAARPGQTPVGAPATTVPSGAFT